MKNVLITGGTRGIGKALVKTFSVAGYRVILNYIKSDDLAYQLKDEYNAVLLKYDITNEADVNKMCDFIISEYGGIDVLINNAGVSLIKMLQDTESEDYDFIFNTNMKSVYMLTKKTVPYMINKKYGKIINISSMWGIRGASCETVYSASKAAIIGFTKALSKELGPSNINVNCIAPGVILTDMNKGLDKETLDGLKEETPLERLGTPSDIAKTALFLASEDASFITGQVICVDGGLTV